MLLAILLHALDPNPRATAVDEQLIAASKKGDLAEVRRLLARNAEPSNGNRDRINALCVAAEAGHLEILKLLAAKAFGFANCAGGEVLDYAIRSGVPDVVRFVAQKQQISHYAFRVHRAAAAAARDGKPALIASLLAAGADLNAIDSEITATALHRLATEGHGPGVELLLRAGADPTLVVRGKSPADAARAGGHEALSAAIDEAAEAWRAARARDAADAYLDSPRYAQIAEQDGYALATLRNEIFARHGQPFKSPQWVRLFSLRPWYKPVAPVTEDALTGRERAVLKVIREREAALGGALRFQ